MSEAVVTNKVIVITGASSGIGLECLKILSKGQGNQILAVSRHAVDTLTDFAPNVIPFDADITTEAGVDSIFAKAEELWDKVDIFYNNAGFPYFEQYNYCDWARIDRIFRGNSISPIYMYAKYMQHLNGRPGHVAYTISAMGQMAMPGYALYTATKFALHGFQQAIRLEMPKNVNITCLYPVATATNFFNVAADGKKFAKPFPVQKAEIVAKKMCEGLAKEKDSIFPCGLFVFAKVLMTAVPPVRSFYWGVETHKFWKFIESTK